LPGPATWISLFYPGFTGKINSLEENDNEYQKVKEIIDQHDLHMLYAHGSVRL
jgi:hypothetical protein